MKIKILIAGLLIVSIISCKKTFLEIPNPNGINDNNFYKTDADFKLAINGVYAGIKALIGDKDQNPSGAVGAWVMGEMRSDNTEYVYSAPDRGVVQIEQIADFLDDANNTTTLRKYTACYGIIASANAILQTIDAADITEDVKKNVKGQALFLRAYSFFELVQYFGDVPFPLTAANSLESAQLPRTKKEDIYTQIITDATSAVSLLPKKADQEKGRVSTGSANMLLGYIYMTLKQYPQAEAAFKLVDNGDYSLVTDYADIFNPLNKNNSESIFEAQYLEGDNGLQSNFAYFFAPKLADASLISNMPSNAQTRNTGGWNFPSASLIAAYETGDKRKSATLALNTIADINGIVSPFYCKKYLHTHSQDRNTNDNWPVYRYADALLLLAEALNEQGKSGEAVPYIVKVRTRAGLTMPFTVTNQAALRDTIAHERRVELAFENHRWLDLVRTGKAVSVMNSYGASIKSNPAYTYLLPASYNVTDNRLLFPIPASERIKNPALTQNPGY